MSGRTHANAGYRRKIRTPDILNEIVKGAENCTDCLFLYAALHRILFGAENPAFIVHYAD